MMEMDYIQVHLKASLGEDLKVYQELLKQEQAMPE